MVRLFAGQVLLPLRMGDEPVDTGGKYIVSELYRNTRLKPPTYILCLTQYDELKEDFHPIWRTIKYDPSAINWKTALRELLIYISRQHSTDNRIIIEKTPTIYVEGKTDVKILTEALKLFFPDSVGKIRIKSETGAGADWVTRQLIIWASSLPKDEKGNYIKCAGIYDNDAKGKEAIADLNRTIKEHSAESLCFRAFKYSTGYAKHLIPIYQKGIQLPISLEEMFDYAYWEIASKNHWLEERNHVDLLLKEPANWNKRTMSLNEHIKSLGFTGTENLYLSKVANEAKGEFCDYVTSLPVSQRKEAFKPFSLILKDVIDYLIK